MVGPYRLLGAIGEGGMSSVWLAERTDGVLRRKIALKLPHWWALSKLTERATQEREILASLEHPNIARLYDAGITEDGGPYLALEYIEGKADRRSTAASTSSTCVRASRSSRRSPAQSRMRIRA